MKKSWVKAYMAINDDHSAMDCFKELGEGLIQNQLANGKLPTQVKDLEKFICQVYCKAGLRWELFWSKNLEDKMLPPTCAYLLPHITHAYFMAINDKSYTTSCPDLPPIKENSWSEHQGASVPVMCLSLPWTPSYYWAYLMWLQVRLQGTQWLFQEQNSIHSSL